MDVAAILLLIVAMIPGLGEMLEHPAVLGEEV